MNLNRPCNKWQLASQFHSAAKAGTPRLQQGAAIENKQVPNRYDHTEVQEVQRPQQLASYSW